MMHTWTLHDYIYLTNLLYEAFLRKNV